MVWLWRRTHGLVAPIVSDPLLVLNFSVWWIVDGMDCNWKSISRPSMMPCSIGKCATENFIVCVTLSLPSWLVIVRERCMVSSGHKLCLVNPMSELAVGGAKPSFQEAIDGNDARKGCRYHCHCLCRHDWFVFGICRKLSGADPWGSSPTFLGLLTKN